MYSFPIYYCAYYTAHLLAIHFHLNDFQLIHLSNKIYILLLVKCVLTYSRIKMSRNSQAIGRRQLRLTTMPPNLVHEMLTDIGRRQLRLTSMPPHPNRAAPELGAWNAYRHWEAAASADHYASAPQSGSPRTWCMECLQTLGGGSFG